MCTAPQNISETDLSAHYTVWHVVVEMVQAGITTSGGMCNVAREDSGRGGGGEGVRGSRKFFE
jgi:hypothetical protein